MIKKNLTSSIILVMMLLITPCVSAQTYRPVSYTHLTLPTKA